MNIEKVYKAESINQVLDLLDKYREDSKIIAGGTDIIIGIRNKKLNPKILIDISHLQDLKKIKTNKDSIEIGSCVTFTDIVESEFFNENLYGLKKSAREVGSPQIRNKGTLGGNIANGSSAADIVPPLMALGARLVMKNANGSREVLLEDYYKDPIKNNELLTKIVFKKPEEGEILTFSKLGLRKALAISRLTISSFISLGEKEMIKDIRIASGALAKYPMRERELENYLIGKELNEKTILESIEVLKASMDERLEGRSTLPYKRIAISTILKDALEDCLRNRNGVEEWKS